MASVSMWHTKQYEQGRFREDGLMVEGDGGAEGSQNASLPIVVDAVVARLLTDRSCG